MKETIYAKCVRPVSKVKIVNQATMTVHVKFKDGTRVIRKIDLAFRHFMYIMQSVDFKLRELPVDICTKSPIDFYDVFGITDKDTVVFSEDEHEFFTYFSSSQ